MKNRLIIEIGNDGYSLEFELPRLISVRQDTPGCLQVEMVNEQGYRVQGTFWLSDQKQPPRNVRLLPLHQLRRGPHG